MPWYDAEGAEKVREDLAPKPAAIDLSIYKSSNANGFQLEYNGSAFALGGASNHVPFDTVYLTPDGTTSQALANGATAANDYFTVTLDPGGVATLHFLKEGLWHVDILVQFDAALASPLHVDCGLTDLSGYAPAGAVEYRRAALALMAKVSSGDINNARLLANISSIASGDQAKHINYAWISMYPVMLLD